MNTTKLHICERLEKCLDCGGQLIFLRETRHNEHWICDDCEAVFYWGKELTND